MLDLIMFNILINLMKILLIFLLNIVLASTYRDEKIITAQQVERISTDKTLRLIDVHHHGILVKTSLGNNYLIHNVPNTGIVVTKTPLSENWSVKKNILVKGHKTIGGAMASNFGFTNVGIVNYLTSMTCIGTAKKVGHYLEN